MDCGNGAIPTIGLRELSVTAIAPGGYAFA
jgi:hypothetical protein